MVYDNNIENLVGGACSPNRFDNLINFMKRQTYSPDVFTVQQVSNIYQLNQLTQRLSDEFPGTYGGVIAVALPGSMGFTDPCFIPKNQQTNAIIYRTGRLQLEDTARWRSDALVAGGVGGSCLNLYGDFDTSQDRVVNVAARFRDLRAGSDVTVASIHWPTSNWNGADCADENMREAEAAVDGLGGAMKIVAGDTNAVTSRRDWWQERAIDQGFRDPMSEQCGARECGSAWDTFYGNDNPRRIDFMLVKGGHGFSAVDTISFADAGGQYSDHRALKAYVRY